MIVCVPVTPDGDVEPGFGRARRVAIGRVDDGRLVEWAAHDVGWDALHDTGTEGGHHARIARFLLDEHVEAVVAQHMGEGMRQMLASMQLRVVLGAAGDARQAVLAVA